MPADACDGKGLMERGGNDELVGESDAQIVAPDAGATARWYDLK